MPKLSPMSLTIMLSLTLFVGVAQAQSSKGAASGGIICWKDKAGKVVGCGDKVPPEYQNSATEEQNKRGVTVKETEAARTPEQVKEQKTEAERKKAADAAKTEQARQDRALLDTYTDVKEIDRKRDRDRQPLESSIETYQANIKSAESRQADLRAKIEQYKKNKQAVPPGMQSDFDKIEGDKAKMQAQIDQRRKDIVELNEKYDAMKKRFIELKSGGSANAPASAPGRAR